MKIQIIDDVFYDTESESQDEKYYEWFQKEIAPRLGGENSLPYVKDKFGRPTQYTLELKDVNVIITREYINPKSGSWAKRCDTVTVERKEVGDE
jgi:hypothetical protein